MSKLPTVASFDDVRALLADLPGPDNDAAKKAAAREPQLTKPEGALGQLEMIAKWMATWQGAHPPRFKKPKTNVYAGNHGVTAKGVSAFPAEVTLQMVANFQAGGAAINQLCEAFGAELKVFDLDLETPTQDMTEQPAMSEAECVEAIAFGIKSVNPASDVLCLGEMGIGNTTPAAAISLAVFGGAAEQWTGPGTGVEGDALGRKIAVVGDAVALHKTTMTDGLEVMRCVGGRELAAIAGAVIGARLHRVPVVLDGFVATAAAAPLQAMHPGALDHCLIGHTSTEPGHQKLIAALGKEAILNLNMRLGEASGAAVCLGIIKAAIACHVGMATFAEAAVSTKSGT